MGSQQEVDDCNVVLLFAHSHDNTTGPRTYLINEYHSFIRY